MARIYTRTGDGGETGLLGGARVRKDSTRVAACGTVDELNAALGVARAARLAAADDAIVGAIQQQLFALGQLLATPPPAVPQTGTIGDRHIEWLERTIDRRQLELEPLNQFILPGGTETAAALHLARCVCRRAERLVVRLSAEAPMAVEPVKYLNRLSDLLFVLARAANHVAGRPDMPWQQDPA